MSSSGLKAYLTWRVRRSRKYERSTAADSRPFTQAPLCDQTELRRFGERAWFGWPDSHLARGADAFGQQARASAASDLPSASDLLDMVPDSPKPKAQGDAGSAVTLLPRGPDSIKFQVPSYLGVVLLTPQRSRMAALASDRGVELAAPAGTFQLIPTDADSSGQWSTPEDTILFSISPARLTEIAKSEFKADTFKLRAHRSATSDCRVVQLALLLREELGRGTGASRLYVDALVTAMAVHILRRHSTIGEVVADADAGVPRGGLAGECWRVVRSYLHEHLAEPLTIAQLADVAGLSPSHFLRAFRETTGEPPHRYLRELRVASAEQLIVTTELPLKVIAERTGFASQSHMTASMRDLRHTTPGEIRRSKAPERS